VGSSRRHGLDADSLLAVARGRHLQQDLPSRGGLRPARAKGPPDLRRRRAQGGRRRAGGQGGGGAHAPGCSSSTSRSTSLPVPYSIYERVRGETLGCSTGTRPPAPRCGAELGHDLALLHSGVSEDGPVAGLEMDEMPDPRPWPDGTGGGRVLHRTEARWLEEWLDGWLRRRSRPSPGAFLHGDSQATNVMVEAGSLEYVAVLDWGSCGGETPRGTSPGYRCGSYPRCSKGTARSRRSTETRTWRPAYCGATSSYLVPAAPRAPAWTLLGGAPAGNAARRHALLARLPRREMVQMDAVERPA
jgi:hypothetical protein